MYYGGAVSIVVKAEAVQNLGKVFLLRTSPVTVGSKKRDAGYSRVA